MAKQRTLFQQAQSTGNLRKANATRSHPCNTITQRRNHTPELSIVRHELVKQKAKSDQLAKSLRNKTKEASRAKTMRDRLRQEKNHLQLSSRKRGSRAPLQKAKALSKALSNAGTTPGTFHLKHQGIVKDGCREMIRDLVASNVPESRINTVIHVVGKGLNIEVEDSVDSRTVRRVIQEGGVASKIQLVHEIQQSKGHTISGDGTTIKNLNYEAKHITLQVPSYEKGVREAGTSTTPATRFFGVSSGPNHKSETQLQAWKCQAVDYYSTYNKTSLGVENPANILTFAANILGLGSDHAEDQKKLDRLVREWKTVSDRTFRGQKQMEITPPADLLPIIIEENQRKLDEVGGLTAWEALPEDIQDIKDHEVYDRLCLRIGEGEWTKLSDEEKRSAQLYAWTGCCMHKEMNSVKGAVRGMAEFWRESGVDGPLTLFNRDNAVAATSGPSAALNHALDSSQGGAVKLTSLAGALFHHKDNKKGHQDTYRIFFERRLGYPVRFPDTSNTRFQSHCDAAAELLVHLPFYLEFLLLIRDKKENRSFNHMENNVFNGLKDIPTLTELCALTLYSLAITHPYMRVVRGSGERRVNALELGPLHDKVRAHCSTIISNPGLLLDPDADYVKGTLDECVWERPEAFYAVQQMLGSLPHLEGCLVSCFQGALGTWGRFSTEFSEGSTINSLSGNEKRRAFIPATNDHNEGALGGLRLALRRAPSMSLAAYNSRTMYTQNNTSSFISRILTPADQAFTRREARRLASLGLEQQRRQKQAQHDQATVEEKRNKDAERKQKADARQAALDDITPELDVEVLKTTGGRLSVSTIVSQINWHRRNDLKIPSKTLIQRMKKDDKLMQLIITVERYNQELQTNNGLGLSQAEASVLPQLQQPAHNHMDWEELEDLQDADMDSS